MLPLHFEPDSLPAQHCLHLEDEHIVDYF